MNEGLSIKKLDYIDALRGLAILGVIMVHTSQYGSTVLPGFISDIIRQGSRGVQLFYLASAFTLFLSFKFRSNSEKFPIRNFFVRRFFRIAPMYYLGICYYLFQDGTGARHWLGNESHVTSANIISNFLFLHGFNPYWINSVVPGGWSIGVEMTFYFIFPFLFSKIKNINQIFNIFVICLFLKLLPQLFFMKFHFISDNNLWSEYLALYFPSQLPVFCLGIILYFLAMDGENIKKISGSSLLIFSILLIAQLTIRINFILSEPILFGIGFLILGLALSKNRNIIIVNPIITYIGKISFSMYLVHFAVLHWLTYLNFIDYFKNSVINYITRYILVNIITIMISTLFYKIIEVPFQGFGKKIITKFERLD